MKKKYICPQILDNEEFDCEFELLGGSVKGGSGTEDITYGGVDENGDIDPSAKIFRFDTYNGSEDEDDF